MACRSAASASPWPNNAIRSRGWGALPNRSGSEVSSTSRDMSVRLDRKRESAHALAYRPPDVLFHLVRDAPSVDEHAPLGMGGRDLPKSLPERLVEGLALRLETIGPLLGRFIASPSSAQAQIGRDVEDNGEIRLGLSYDHSIQGSEDPRINFAECALVGAGRIGEAVAEDVDTLIQGRPDQVFEMVQARRVEKERLPRRTKIPGPTAEECQADFLRFRRSARLTGHDNGVAQAGQTSPQPVDLSRFPGPLPAFERDEAPSHQPRSVRLVKARRNRPEPNSRSPSRARWLNVPV